MCTLAVPPSGQIFKQCHRAWQHLPSGQHLPSRQIWTSYLLKQIGPFWRRSEHPIQLNSTGSFVELELWSLLRLQTTEFDNISLCFCKHRVLNIFRNSTTGWRCTESDWALFWLDSTQNVQNSLTDWVESGHRSDHSAQPDLTQPDEPSRTGCSDQCLTNGQTDRPTERH